jgi:RNA polymerase sigma-70 factor (ECF subfamily)
MDTTSLSLLERLRRPGEQAAWERFVELYTPLLYDWACRLGLQPQDAADLVQDVFVTLVRTMPEFEYDHHKSFRAWLKTVAVNRWRDLRRQRVPQPTGAGDDLPDPRPGAAEAEAFEEAAYQQALAARALDLVKNDFHPATWAAFWEHGVEDRPAAAVAAELGLSVGAVYAAKFRVLDRVRREVRGIID